MERAGNLYEVEFANIAKLMFANGWGGKATALYPKYYKLN
jgi:hypothetical protein